MKTFLAHSISMSMVPISREGQPLEEFTWRFNVIPPEEVFSIIHAAEEKGQFSNCIALAMMDDIMRDVAAEHGTFLLPPKGRGHVALEEGDTLLIVRYSGRKLEVADRTLPKDTKLTFYKMELVVGEAGDTAVRELVNNM